MKVRSLTVHHPSIQSASSSAFLLPPPSILFTLLFFYYYYFFFLSCLFLLSLLLLRFLLLLIYCISSSSCSLYSSSFFFPAALPLLSTLSLTPLLADSVYTTFSSVRLFSFYSYSSSFSFLPNHLLFIFPFFFYHLEPIFPSTSPPFPSLILVDLPLFVFFSLSLLLLPLSVYFSSFLVFPPLVAIFSPIANPLVKNIPERLFLSSSNTKLYLSLSLPLFLSSPSL